MKKKLAAVILAGCMIMTTACTKEVQQTPAGNRDSTDAGTADRRTNVNNGNREHH